MKNINFIFIRLTDLVSYKFSLCFQKSSFPALKLFTIVSLALRSLQKFQKLISQTQHSWCKDRIRSHPCATLHLTALKEAQNYSTLHWCSAKKQGLAWYCEPVFTHYNLQLIVLPVTWYKQLLLPRKSTQLSRRSFTVGVTGWGWDYIEAELYRARSRGWCKKLHVQQAKCVINYSVVSWCNHCCYKEKQLFYK